LADHPLANGESSGTPRVCDAVVAICVPHQVSYDVTLAKWKLVGGSDVWVGLQPLPVGKHANFKSRAFQLVRWGKSPNWLDLLNTNPSISAIIKQ